MRILRTESEKPSALTEVFDVLTHQTHRELGTVTETLFFIGDGLQRAAVDGVFDLLALQTWTPRNLLRLGCGAVDKGLRLAALFLPDQASLAWRELRNK